MSKFSLDVRKHFFEVLQRNNLETIEITASRWSSSVFSSIFWKEFTKLLLREKDIKIVFNFPTDIDYQIFSKIEEKIKIFSSGKKYDKARISYTLQPLLSEDVMFNQIAFSIIADTSFGHHITFSFSRDKE